MKAQVLESVGNLVYKEIVKPTVKAGEVLLKIRACGICSSDIPRIFKTGTYHFPTIPGHEFSGEIVSVATDVSRDYIGKKVAVFPLLPCGKCPSCLEGEYARCDNYNYFGSRCDGGFAEYLAVPVWNCVVIPDRLSYKKAALCEPLAVALHAIRTAELRKDDNVLVLGTGTIGLLAALLAKRSGCRVSVAGRSANKCDFVKSLGFDQVINTKTDALTDLKYKKVVECVGTPETISLAICALDKGGLVVLTGNPSDDVCLEKNVYWKILRNELTVKGIWNSSYNEERNDWKDAVDVLCDDNFPAEKIITNVYKLEECDKALNLVKDRSMFSIKVMIEV